MAEMNRKRLKNALDVISICIRDEHPLNRAFTTTTLQRLLILQARLQLPKMPPPPFLVDSLAHDGSHPLITLTYAQSLDASIAGPERQQIRLSGEESMLMTHW
jgi:hypothetical protein